MGPGYFVIAILGCADGGSSCTQVATLQTRYESAAQCSAATTAALEANTNFDYATLLARCSEGSAALSSKDQINEPIPASARRG